MDDITTLLWDYYWDSLPWDTTIGDGRPLACLHAMLCGLVQPLWRSLRGAIMGGANYNRRRDWRPPTFPLFFPVGSPSYQQEGVIEPVFNTPLVGPV